MVTDLSMTGLLINNLSADQLLVNQKWIRQWFVNDQSTGQWLSNDISKSVLATGVQSSFVNNKFFILGVKYLTKAGKFQIRL